MPLNRRAIIRPKHRTGNGEIAVKKLTESDATTKHAYLFMVHSNFPVVQAAFRIIDDPRNDIFVRAEGEEDIYAQVHLKHSKVHVVNCKTAAVWGGTIHRAEMELIKFAAQSGKYGYLHLLSESCLPIKTQDEIHSFFDSNPENPIYLHVNCHVFPEIQDRCKTKYPFVNRYWFRKSKWIKALALAMVKTKIAFGVNRLKHNQELPVIWGGWNWFSIPGDFAAYVVEKESLIYQTFDNTLAADEVFLQTLAMNSRFRDRMYGFDGRDDAQNASKRMINWNKKHWTPLVFTARDYDAIMANKNCFFARKFYADVDMEIVRKLEVALTGESPILL